MLSFLLLLQLIHYAPTTQGCWHNEHRHPKRILTENPSALVPSRNESNYEKEHSFLMSYGFQTQPLEPSILLTCQIDKQQTKYPSRASNPLTSDFLEAVLLLGCCLLLAL
ncbi:hypothetical protein MHU86_21572 [Fragilaria crotonensis]|nr:hypothetical protein MHU86_21572 [Fragilaria crotonensis]